MILISLNSRGDQHFVQVSVRQPAVMQHIWKLDHFGSSAGVRWSQQYCNVVMSIQQHLQWLSWSGRATGVIVSKHSKTLMGGCKRFVTEVPNQGSFSVGAQPIGDNVTMYLCLICWAHIQNNPSWSQISFATNNAVITALAFGVMVSKGLSILPNRDLFYWHFTSSSKYSREIVQCQKSHL